MNRVEESGCSVSRSSGDPDPCPICLGSVNREAYLDRCFHRYCYDCILRWTKVVSARACSGGQASSIQCPFCKTVNFSIVYGYVENRSQPNESLFQRHYIGHVAGQSFYSEAHKYRWWCYSIDKGASRDTFDVTRYWKSRKYLQMNPWLQRWLQREIQALTQEEDVDIIVYHIHGVIESFSRRDDRRGQTQPPDLKQTEFKAMVADAARPFLTARTDRFVTELELFLASGLNVDAYDNTYRRKVGWQRPEATVCTSDNADHSRIGPYAYLFKDSDEAD